MLGARELKQAQHGTIYTGFLKFLPPFLYLMPGIFCLALKPDLDIPDKAVFMYLALLRSIASPWFEVICWDERPALAAQSC